MYEPHHHPPLSLTRFIGRLVQHLLMAGGVIAGSLLIGMIGYHLFEGLPWVDAFLNASMLLGGMGPVDPPRTEAGKLFAGLYALYAGLVFIVAAGLLVAPMLHRILHLFHWKDTHNR